MPTLAELTQAALSAPAALSSSMPASGVTPSSTVGSGAHPAPTVAFSFGGGPVPPPAPAEPYLTELITSRELASLAAKLVRAKSDDKQSLGRALLHAIRGEPFAPQGQRNKTAFQLAGEIVEEYPNCDPESVLACLSASVSRVQALGSKLTEASWLSMISRLQDERRARLNTVKHVAGKLGRDLQAYVSAPNTPMPLTVQTAIESGPAVWRTLIIKADGDYYIRRPDQESYEFRAKTHEDLALIFDEHFGTDNSVLHTRDIKGEPIPMADLVRAHATHATKIVHDYSSPKTTWDPVGRRLHVGFPDALPAAEPCDRVHAWLVALAGLSPAHPERAVHDLYDWIASTTREHINHPAAGLVVIGETGTGKSLLALALALTWGVHTVKLSNAIERFNGSLLSSPFWHADEDMPEDLTTARYRDLTQERSRLVEPKGREKVELLGCPRIVVTLNEPEDLRLGAVSGPSALDAVIGRIAYFDCTQQTAQAFEALEALRFGPGHARPYDVDLTRIVRHLRWVQTAWAQAAGAPRAQRFLGARADKTESTALVVKQTITRNNAPAIEALVDYLSDPSEWERTYHVEKRAFSTGQRCPCITRQHMLWVWPSELAARLQLKPWESTGLKQMLKSLRAGPPTEITFANKALRKEYWPVDLEKLVVAASIEPGSEAWHRIATSCTQDTKDRLPSLV